MKKDYLEKLITLLKQANPQLASTYEIKFKNVFGAVAGYVNDNIFISCGKFGVALRLPQETLAELFKEKSVKHLKYFPKGHIKKEYAVLPKRILEDQKQFRELIDKSVTYTFENNLAEDCGHEGFDVGGKSQIINNRVVDSHASVVVLRGSPTLKGNTFQDEVHSLDGTKPILIDNKIDSSLICDKNKVWDYENYRIPCMGEPYLTK